LSPAAGRLWAVSILSGVFATFRPPPLPTSLCQRVDRQRRILIGDRHPGIAYQHYSPNRRHVATVIA
jgi:hypothetical protein